LTGDERGEARSRYGVTTRGKSQRKEKGLVRSLVVGTENKEEEGLDRDTQREKDLTKRKRIESEKRERQRGVEQ
jgi:hypothetical protein